MVLSGFEAAPSSQIESIPIQYQFLLAKSSSPRFAPRLWLSLLSRSLCDGAVRAPNALNWITLFHLCEKLKQQFRFSLPLAPHSLALVLRRERARWGLYVVTHALHRELCAKYREHGLYPTVCLHRKAC